MSFERSPEKKLYLSKDNYEMINEVPEGIEEIGSDVNAFEGFSAWKICKGIKAIKLFGRSCKMTSLESLKNFPNLEEIQISTAKLLTDVSFVKQLPKLKLLDLSFAPITSLDALANHSNISEVKARKSSVISISGMTNCKNLKTLYLEKSKLKSIEGIKDNLPNLEHLWIWETKLKDLNPLVGMTSIKNLDVTMLKPNSWEFIKTLNGLEILDLCKSSFSDVKLLLPLTNLKYVRLSGCEVDFSSKEYKNFEIKMKERKVGIKRPLPELPKVKESQQEVTEKIFDSLMLNDFEDFYTFIESVHINNTDEDRNSFLHRAIVSGNKDIVKKLLKLGIDVNIQAKGGNTALHYLLSSWPEYEIAKLIVDSGADVNLTDGYGSNVLTYSIKNNDKKLTQLFLDAGADPYLPNAFGQTAFDIAKDFERTDLVKTLKIQGK